MPQALATAGAPPQAVPSLGVSPFHDFPQVQVGLREVQVGLTDSRFHFEFADVLQHYARSDSMVGGHETDRQTDNYRQTQAREHADRQI